MTKFTQDQRQNQDEVKRLTAEIAAREPQARPHSHPEVQAAHSALTKLQDAYEAECGDTGSLRQAVTSAHEAYSKILAEREAARKQLP